jgi:hypothetical protein
MTTLHNQRCSVLSIERPRKTVRITLPPSPPPDVHQMEDIPGPIHPRRSQRINNPFSNIDSTRVVLPTDSVEDVERLGSGSKWSHHDLALLKVKFDPEEESDLSMLNTIEWTSSQRQSNLSLNLGRV